MTPKSLIEPARHAGATLLRSQSDARLVDLTRDGNERAFEAIVQRYSRPLLRYCSRLLPSARAEDAVQQAFLSAHRAIHAGDAELNLRPWLYRIAHNASLNLLRQNGFDHEQVSEQIDGVETPPQAFERGERLRTVVAAVQELPERQRSAIVLQAVEGRSYDEIAVELGVTDGAVRQLLNRARTTLREGVTALTPTGLLTRLAAGEASPVAERVAAAVASAGGGAILAKAGAAIVVAGAVAGGTAVGGSGDHAARGDAGSRGTAAAAVVAPAPERREAALVDNRQTKRAHGQPHPNRTDNHRSARRDHDTSGTEDHHSGGRDDLDSGTEEHHSGDGADDHSGPSSGSGDDSGSGSGSGDDGGSSGSGSSGSGGDDGATSGSDSSGPGSGSTGTSGSGGDDGVTSGTDSSGSGSSGSGSSGSSGSDDSALTTDTSGSGSGSDDGGTSGSGRH